MSYISGCLRPRLSGRFGRDFVTIESGRARIIFLLQWHVGFIAWLRLEEVSRLLVSAYFHFLQFDIFPFVERNRANETQVNAQTSMFAGTLETYEYAVCDTNPLRIVRVTFETRLLNSYVLLIKRRSLNLGVQNLAYSIFLFEHEILKDSSRSRRWHVIWPQRQEFSFNGVLLCVW